MMNNSPCLLVQIKENTYQMQASVSNLTNENVISNESRNKGRSNSMHVACHFIMGNTHCY